MATVPFVFVVSRFKLAMSCFWFAESVIVTVPALTPLFVVALSLPLSFCPSMGAAPPAFLPDVLPCVL
ncbi:hypothetical protein WT55_06435 [Burkholderia pseudomultivorans]|nr:hypothetical protein WT55_06435 [Burkholderia pseudomultivorans]